jgi:hypothetical protein
MKGATMHGMCGEFHKSVRHSDEERDDGGSELQDVDADFCRVAALPEIGGKRGETVWGPQYIHDDQAKAIKRRGGARIAICDDIGNRGLAFRPIE